MRYKKHILILVILFTVCTVFQKAGAQSSDLTQPEIIINKGKILTSFSVGWINANRDSYNHEFEKGFNRLNLTIDGLYFLNDHIGVGPVFGYQYLFRDLEDPTGVFNAVDHYEWDYEYGIQAGYYSPASDLFNTEGLGNSLVFFNGGVSWLKNKREWVFNTAPETNISYSISTGLLIPVGSRIGLEGRLKWQAHSTEIRQGYIDDDGTAVITSRETKWPTTLSLGLSLKVLIGK